MTKAERNDMRQVFFTAWHKYNHDEPLNAVERQVMVVIQAHPEYHPLLNDSMANLTRDYPNDNNPFLHLGLHVSLLEQIHTNRPAGITTIYHRLSEKLDNSHRAEHTMMDVLGNVLWQAQQDGTLPDEQDYLRQLERLLG